MADGTGGSSGAPASTTADAILHTKSQGWARCLDRGQHAVLGTALQHDARGAKQQPAHQEAGIAAKPLSTTLGTSQPGLVTDQRHAEACSPGGWYCSAGCPLPMGRPGLGPFGGLGCNPLLPTGLRDGCTGYTPHQVSAGTYGR